MWNNTIRNVDTLSKFKSELKKIDKTENHAIPKHYLGTEHLTFRGGLWFFVSFRNFFSDNTRVGIFIFFVVQSAKFFSPEFNIRLYDKNSESDFFFPPPKSEYFFQQHWESEYFFRKKTYPPFKLNGRSLIWSSEI